MVSSTVYDKRDLLEQAYAVLKAFGYDVWMSDKGTLPIRPGLTAFENCLQGVEDCDLFLGILTGRYGAAEGDGLSITHQEFERALTLDKPRYFAVHEHIVTARQLLKQFRFDGDGNKRPHSFLRPNSILSDARVLDMYDLVTQEGRPLSERKSNWAQIYHSPADLMTFLEAQFSDLQRVRTNLQTLKEPV